MKCVNDAQFCRDRGYEIGQLLKSTVPSTMGHYVVKVTAIGQAAILARRSRAAEGHNWDLDKCQAVPATKFEYAEPFTKGSNV